MNFIMSNWVSIVIALGIISAFWWVTQAQQRDKNQWDEQTRISMELDLALADKYRAEADSIRATQKRETVQTIVQVGTQLGYMVGGLFRKGAKDGTGNS